MEEEGDGRKFEIGKQNQNISRLDTRKIAITILVFSGFHTRKCRMIANFQLSRFFKNCCNCNSTRDQNQQNSQIEDPVIILRENAEEPTILRPSQNGTLSYLNPDTL